MDTCEARVLNSEANIPFGDNCNQCYEFFSKIRQTREYRSIYLCPTVFDNRNECLNCIDYLNNRKELTPYINMKIAPIMRRITSRLQFKPDGNQPQFNIYPSSKNNNNTYRVGGNYKV